MFRRSLSLITKFSKTPRYFFCAAGETNITPNKEAPAAQEKKNITYYENGELVSRNQLTLKKYEDIEGYIIKLLQGYYRTINRNNIHLESTLEEHGLDSLDSIELSMQIEEELGYQISAETLPVLQKVKHYVNYIRHVEGFKEEMKKNPLA